MKKIFTFLLVFSLVFLSSCGGEKNIKNTTTIDGNGNVKINDTNVENVADDIIDKVENTVNDLDNLGEENVEIKD